MPYLGYFQEIWSSLRSNSTGLKLLSTLGSDSDVNASLAHIAERLINTRGEATSLLLATQLLDRYTNSNNEQKLQFFKQLLEDFDLDSELLLSLVTAYNNDQNPKDYRAIFNAATSKRHLLFSKLHEVPSGIHALVQMRSDLRKACADDPALLPIDVDLKLLFSSWFNRGFLTLRPIDWTTPAHILEKVIAYEAVHEIRSWAELRTRLEPTDRRCYAFFHLAMPDEPLIFVEVALTTDIPDNIQTLLDGERTPIDSDQASVAVFYSISNCQPGLAGISFGNFLIKQVARELSDELPALKEFVTLSPIPGLQDWLTNIAKAETEVATLLEEINNDMWPDNAKDIEATKIRLKKLTARYLVQTLDDKGKPVNPVARFHLGNGARIERVNFLSDTSANGKNQSSGMMVNYYYDLGKVPQYHEDYALHQKIARSKAINALLEKRPSPKTKSNKETADST